MPAVEVSKEIFEQLKKAYSVNFGSSTKSLISILNDTFSKERDSERDDLISDRTLRGFFNSSYDHSKPPKMQEKNLNYLCRVLLDGKSYREIEEELRKIDIKDLDIYGDWLSPYRESLERTLNSITILYMPKPIPIDRIYVQLNVLENVSKNRRKNIEDLIFSGKNDVNANDKLSRLRFNYSQTKVDPIPFVENLPKLMILGKPGAGKTTFLKFMALHFRRKDQALQQLPIYITLKDFSESGSEFNFDLEKFILHKIESKIEDRSIEDLEERIVTLLKSGYCLVLLDGLDEVIEKNIGEVYRAIEKFTKNYPKNRFMISCRVGASDFRFEGFTEVEIADFERWQVEKFSKQWFEANSKSELAGKFLTKLFENSAVKELATSPLLLTILCCTFDENYSFPKNRHVLFEEAIDVLVRRWDASRRIDRDPIFSDKLSKSRKLTLFGEMAYRGFEQSPPKFVWRGNEIENFIRDFIRDIPGIKLDELDIDTKKVVNALEAHHGLLVEQAANLYSFSHLTFQEFFAAEYLSQQQDPNLIFQIIDKRLTNRQWREIFILMTGRLQNANQFLQIIFIKITELVPSEPLQATFRWLNKFTKSLDVSSSSWRAFFLTLDFDLDLYIGRAIKIDRKLAERLAREMRDYNLENDRILNRKPIVDLILGLGILYAVALDNIPTDDPKEYPKSLEDSAEFTREILKISEEPSLQKALKITIDKSKELNILDLANTLEDLQRELPEEIHTQGLIDWSAKLQEAMIRHFDIGHAFEFSSEDEKALEDYIYVNYLLLDCLRSDSYSSRELREKIFDNLLLAKEDIAPELLKTPELNMPDRLGFRFKAGNSP